MNMKVSVIIPSYNSSAFIGETIKSVQAQTLEDWEMIIVDDCSTDDTCEVVERFRAEDSRIKLFRQPENAGAGAARTRGMREATGRYIAYIDSDDLWMPEKLEKQRNFMSENNYAFTCTSVDVIDESGQSLNKVIHVLPKMDYVGFLTHNVLHTLEIMIDTEQVDRELLVMPDIRRRQDAATWLQILKAGHICYGLDEVLGRIRRTKNSLSSNKAQAAKGVWSLYRDIEKLPLPFASYCFVRYAALAVWKRLYFKRG